MPAMQMVIRQARAEDVAAILPLWRELMRHHAELDPQYRLVPDAPAQAEAHLHAELTAPDSILLVAVYGSAILGYCRASVRQPSPVFVPSPQGFISELHVSPVYRRRGVGRGLFEHVKRCFGERGVYRLELVTLNANDDSGAFWQSMGCEPYAERRFFELTGV